jgi:hypothetical protein
VYSGDDGSDDGYGSDDGDGFATISVGGGQYTNRKRTIKSKRPRRNKNIRKKSIRKKRGNKRIRTYKKRRN